jgi:hypothetical protein
MIDDRGIDDGVAGAAAPPGGERLGVALPGKVVEAGLEVFGGPRPASSSRSGRPPNRAWSARASMSPARRWRPSGRGTAPSVRAGAWRVAEREHPPPERREDAQAPALLVADRRGRDQQISGATLRVHAELCQRRFELFLDGLMRGLSDRIPVDSAGAAVARHFGDHFGRWPSSQRQRSAARCDLGTERPQRLRQPPACRSARHPSGGIIQHIEADHRRAGFGGGAEGGMVGQAEVIAEPDDDGRRAWRGQGCPRLQFVKHAACGGVNRR